MKTALSLSKALTGKSLLFCDLPGIPGFRDWQRQSRRFPRGGGRCHSIVFSDGATHHVIKSGLAKYSIRAHASDAGLLCHVCIVEDTMDIQASLSRLIVRNERRSEEHTSELQSRQY